MAEITITKVQFSTASMSFGCQSQKRKTFGTFSASRSVRKPKSAVVKNVGIDILDIFGPEISANIDISKSDIDPALSPIPDHQVAGRRAVLSIGDWVCGVGKV